MIGVIMSVDDRVDDLDLFAQVAGAFPARCRSTHCLEEVRRGRWTSSVCSWGLPKRRRRNRSRSSARRPKSRFPRRSNALVSQIRPRPPTLPPLRAEPCLASLFCSRSDCNRFRLDSPSRSADVSASLRAGRGGMTVAKERKRDEQRHRLENREQKALTRRGARQVRLARRFGGGVDGLGDRSMGDLVSALAHLALVSRSRRLRDRRARMERGAVAVSRYARRRLSGNDGIVRALRRDVRLGKNRPLSRRRGTGRGTRCGFGRLESKEVRWGLPGMVGFITFLGYELSLDYSQVARRDGHAAIFVVLAILLAETLPRRFGCIAAGMFSRSPCRFDRSRSSSPHSWRRSWNRTAPSKRSRQDRRIRIAATTILAIAFAPLAIQRLLGDFLEGIRLTSYGQGYNKVTLAKFLETFVAQFSLKLLAAPIAVSLLMANSTAAVKRSAQPGRSRLVASCSTSRSARSIMHI